MRLFPRLIALLLLAAWLPATEHCALETAGILVDSCHESGATSPRSCTRDGCSSLESAGYRATLDGVNVPPPAVNASLGRLCLALAAVRPCAVPVLAPAHRDRPQDWVAVWHFVRRTAPPSRAPTSLCA